MSKTDSTTQQAVCGNCIPGGHTKKRWEDLRHLKMLERAIELVQSGSHGEDNAWMRSKDWVNKNFQNGLVMGLHNADYKEPYTGSFWDSHFYDPDTEENYNHKKDPTAKTEALRYFKESLAIRYRDPNAHYDMAYKLGLALHYLTDLSQPMHAANCINSPLIGDLRHEWLEQYADTRLDDFFAADYTNKDAIDEELAGVNSIEQLVKDLARHSKNVFEKRVRSFMETGLFVHMGGGQVSFNNGWTASPDNREHTNLILWDSIPRGEQVAAAFLLHWIRGYESIIDRLYHHFFDRTPDPAGKENYLRSLVNDNYTVRDIVREMASSSEYYERNRGLAAVKKITAREQLFADVLDERPTPTQHPTEEEMKQGLNHAKWFDLVSKMVKSEDYSRRFSDHQIPGYKGISALKSPSPL